LSSQVELIKGLTGEWVEVEKLRSLEQAKARQQLDHLKQLQDVLSQQLGEWKTKVADMENNMTRADNERHKWIEKKESMEQQRQIALDYLRKIEQQCQGLIPMIPSPLAEELELPLRQLQLDKTEQWLVRYQGCLAVIKGMNAFHRRYTLANQNINLNGNKLAVRTLYLGLTKAYFINLDSSRAGFGVPTMEGWLWQERNDLKSNIELALEMGGQSSTRLRLVDLPVELKK
jgi:hypothetical protein